MSNLGAYGFTEFSTHKPTQEKFLQNVEQGLSTKKIFLMPGTEFPASLPEEAPLSPGFYGSSDTVDSHKEKFPKYHEIIFPMMEVIANVVSLPEGPQAPPIQDPTIPIQLILSQLDLDIDIDLDYILPRAPQFVDALKSFPDDYKDLYELLIPVMVPPMEEKELKKFLIELQETINFEGPSLQIPPEVPLPTPPFIDLPAFAIPLFNIPGFGLIAFFISLINAAAAAIMQIPELISSAIDEFLAALRRGLDAIIVYLFDLVYEIIIPVLEDFKHLLAQLGWASTITVIIKYTIGMIIVSVIAFILGPGLIAAGVAGILGLN